MEMKNDGEEQERFTEKQTNKKTEQLLLYMTITHISGYYTKSVFNLIIHHSHNISSDISIIIIIKLQKRNRDLI